MFQTKHGEALYRILMTYPPGSPGLIMALETFVKTAIESARGAIKDEIALTVCEGLHTTPARGLKCRSCYDAEMNVPQMIAVENEIEIARKNAEKE